MPKISFDNWKNSMSFMIDDAFDRGFMKSVESISVFINNNCHQLSDKDKLSDFLTIENEFSSLLKLRALISLIGLSEERLKRVVSMFRFKFNHEEFRSEWDVKQISNAIKSDDYFREIIIEFFLKGRDSRIGVSMPLYYMQHFRLEEAQFIENLRNKDYVERILTDNEIQGKYSNEVGAHVERIILNKIEEYSRSRELDVK